MPHKVEKLLLDIELACAETAGFCAGKNWVDFSRDRLLQLAVERQFEIIGEAMHRLEKLIRRIWARKFPIIGRSSGFVIS
jgi:uncharacterized protein with HEPN domain